MFRFVVIGSVLAYASAEFNCPKQDGRFPDPDQCDKFWECNEGVAEPMLCEDGLVYDIKNKHFNKCDHVFNVDCGDRTELQPAQSNENCPRLNGFFAHPDPSTCHVFVTCIEGAATTTTCPNGLVFDEDAGTCTWPESAKRQGCKIKREKLADGFECPSEPQLNSLGLSESHPKYPHAECNKFYICLNGNAPRQLACEDGRVFSEEKRICDLPENVPECADYFDNDKDSKE